MDTILYNEINRIQKKLEEEVSLQEDFRWDLHVPTNVHPLDGAEEIGSELFICEPYIGMEHGRTHIEISTNIDFFPTSAVISRVFDTPETRIPVNMYDDVLPLVHNTNYFWRYRYEDRNRGWSMWSTPTGFTTSENYEHRTFGDFGTTSLKWFGGVLGENGKIYGIPYSINNILEIDARTNYVTVNFFGDFSGGGNWSGGTLAQNGRIYTAPVNDSRILEIDTTSETPSWRRVGPNLAGLRKWHGSVLGKNGKVYGIPSTSTSILEITPPPRGSSDDVQTNLIPTVTGNMKWYGGCLAPNGKIYCSPYDHRYVLEIDTNTEVATARELQYFDVGTSDFKYGGAVIAPNGKIYCIPHNAEYILEIDASDPDPSIDPPIRFLSTIDLGTTVGKWRGAVLAPNGLIYCIPSIHNNILEIDARTNYVTVNFFGDFSGTGPANWHGGRLAPNGKIYGIPLSGASILEITPPVLENPFMDFDLDPMDREYDWLDYPRRLNPYSAYYNN